MHKTCRIALLVVSVFSRDATHLYNPGNKNGRHDIVHRRHPHNGNNFWSSFRNEARRTLSIFVPLDRIHRDRTGESEAAWDSSQRALLQPRRDLESAGRNRPSQRQTTTPQRTTLRTCAYQHLDRGRTCSNSTRSIH